MCLLMSIDISLVSEKKRFYSLKVYDKQQLSYTWRNSHQEVVKNQGQFKTKLRLKCVQVKACLFLAALHKKWSFQLRILSVNVTKSTDADLVTFNWRNPQWKSLLFMQWGKWIFTLAKFFFPKQSDIPLG